MAGGAAMWVTGCVWLVLHYFLQRNGQYGPELHPLEPWMLKAHGLFLIPALLAMGGLTFVHLPVGWRDRSRRNLGLALTIVAAFLLVTGYLLYYAGGETLREWSAITHWVVGLASPVLFFWHYAARTASKPAARR
jgi:hypothetical protein